MQSNPKMILAFKIGIVLITIVVCESVALLWLLLPASTGTGPQSSAFIFQLATDRNLVKEAYPTIDFAPIYPGMTASEIDQVQRECYSLRYVYAPFVEFRPLPTAKKFVNVTEGGYRMGQKGQPWPPRETDFVVFVFGGSTTFCYGLRDEETLVAALENELQALWPGKMVQCYNFGCGYYFSTQEKVLFEMLLTAGHVPDFAIFIDGLNDYYYAEGRPEKSDHFFAFTAPDLPKEPTTRLYSHDEAPAAVDRLLNRYKDNVRMARAIGDEYEVATLFVGQPVPWFRYPITPVTYPFLTPEGHELCIWGYNRFEKATLRVDFGKNVVWCGNALADANDAMYADSIHYSAAGAKMVAQSIVSRAKQHRLLPDG